MTFGFDPFASVPDTSNATEPVAKSSGLGDRYLTICLGMGQNVEVPVREIEGLLRGMIRLWVTRRRFYVLGAELRAISFGLQVSDHLMEVSWLHIYKYIFAMLSRAGSVPGR